MKCTGPHAMTREEILRQARAQHDEECSCDPRYVMSCPRLAKIILDQAKGKRA